MLFLNNPRVYKQQLYISLDTDGDVKSTVKLLLDYIYDQVREYLHNMNGDFYSAMMVLANHYFNFDKMRNNCDDFFDFPFLNLIMKNFQVYFEEIPPNYDKYQIEVIIESKVILRSNRLGWY